MLLNKVYKAVQQLANKNQVSGILTPAEFNRYAEFAQIELLDESYYNANQQGYEFNYEVSENFSTLKKVQSITLSGGQATKPTDYYYYSSALANYIFNDSGRTTPVEFVRDSEWAERLGSEVNKPSRQFPIMRNMDGFFDVYPQEINNITLTYIKEPIIPWWNYTLSGSTPVFAATGGVTTNPNAGVTAGDSSDFEIDDFEDFVWRICKYMGIETREGDLYQSANAEQNT
tara:strand:+ start:119 stop:808 length:690 start_codon:yes stop_codon:yes gene_type:complete